MTVEEHLSRFAGVPVVEFDQDAEPEPGAAAAWAVRVSYDGDPFSDVFQRFIATVDTASVTHLVIGFWAADYETSAAEPLQMLVDAAPRLPNLKALFFGDIVREEAEISWIKQCDVSPLFGAYPALERLDVRGGMELELPPLSSTALKVLRFESGGLPAEVVRAIGASDLPNLQTLDLWLGDREYGGNTTVDDLAGILGGERLPALTRLGLMNSEIQDEICAAVATAPVVARLSELALSMGVLTNDGAKALLSGQPLTHLIELDLRHHYLTGPMAARLRSALSQVKLLLLDDPESVRDGRYVAVSE